MLGNYDLFKGRVIGRSESTVYRVQVVRFSKQHGLAGFREIRMCSRNFYGINGYGCYPVHAWNWIQPFFTNLQSKSFQSIFTNLQWNTRYFLSCNEPFPLESGVVGCSLVQEQRSTPGAGTIGSAGGSIQPFFRRSLCDIFRRSCTGKLSDSLVILGTRWNPRGRGRTHSKFGRDSNPSFRRNADVDPKCSLNLTFFHRSECWRRGF